MVVKKSVVNELITFECIESQSGACFFKVSSQKCIKEATTTICTVMQVDNFELLPGNAKKFIANDNKDGFLYCASAFELKADNKCTVSEF